jgi:hypothetical protein
MQIAFHLGAHCTDEDRLLKALLKNKHALARSGIAVPAPKRYRPLLREALAKLRGADATPEMVDTFRKQILGGASATRLFLSLDGFLCAPRFAIGPRRIYPQIGDRINAMQGLFPDQETQFSIGVRNPATFIPALHNVMSTDISFERLIAPVDLKALRWSETIAMVQKAAPHSKVIVWANEDTPFIWPDILKDVSGHPSEITLSGTEELLKGVIKPAGMQRLRAYFEERPNLDRAGRQKITDIFLDKFADPKAFEEKFELPGWTDATIWELTRAYELDLDRIAKMPGVHMIRT